VKLLQFWGSGWSCNFLKGKSINSICEAEMDTRVPGYGPDS
jgi:hypothetical protein